MREIQAEVGQGGRVRNVGESGGGVRHEFVFTIDVTDGGVHMEIMDQKGDLAEERAYSCGGDDAAVFIPSLCGCVVHACKNMS